MAEARAWYRQQEVDAGNDGGRFGVLGRALAAINEAYGHRQFRSGYFKVGHPILADYDGALRPFQALLTVSGEGCTDPA